MTSKAFAKPSSSPRLLAAGGARRRRWSASATSSSRTTARCRTSRRSRRKCGIKVEERVFAKGLDVMQAIIAGELDVGTTASEAAISGRAGDAPIYVVAGFAKGGARLVAAAGARTSRASRT